MTEHSRIYGLKWTHRGTVPIPLVVTNDVILTFLGIYVAVWRTGVLQNFIDQFIATSPGYPTIVLHPLFFLNDGTFSVEPEVAVFSLYSAEFLHIP